MNNLLINLNNMNLYNLHHKQIGILAFLLFFYTNVWGQSAIGQDFLILNKVYEVNKNPVDFILVIDQSGSVQNYWEPILSSASQIVSLANEGDYITLIGFKETVDNLILARRINSANRNSIVNEIRNLPKPTGNYTDLYESVDFTLERGINRPDGNKLQIIFYFTDFKNDPSPSSRWRNTSTNVLKTKRINYVDKAGKLINIFAFQLPLDAGAGRDYNEFSEIFDNKVKRIISDLNTMQEWFSRLSQEISREKLKLLLQNDLNNFLSVKDIKLKGNQIKIEVQNKLGFPFEVKHLDLKSDNFGTCLSQPIKDIVIPANENSVISLSFSDFLLKHSSLLEKKVNIINPIITLQCSFNSLEREFAKLNTPADQSQTVKYHQSIIIGTGIPYWMVGAAAFLFILVIYFINKTWLKPEWTFNRKGFKVTVTLDGKLIPNSIKTYEKSKKLVTIEHTIVNVSDVNPEMARLISESQFKIYVVPSKPRFFSGKPKRGTYLFAEGKNISFKVKKLVKGKVQYASVPSNRKLFTERVFLHKGVAIIGELNAGINKAQLEFSFYNK